MNTLPPLREDAKRTLDEYRSRSPGPARARRNLQAVVARIAREPKPAPVDAGWRWGWAGLAAAAAVLLLLGLAQLGHFSSVDDDGRAAELSADMEVAPQTEAKATERTSFESSPKATDVQVSKPKRARPVPSRSTRPLVDAKQSDLLEETRLLRDVRGDLAAGRLDAAAQGLQEHRRRFSNGVLREDRDAYDLIVSCRLGKSMEPRRLAFLQRYPHSPHVPRIADACGEIPVDKE